jgi:CBS domain-containing protein
MLLPCPYCGADVIQGTDECESCGQTLTDTHLPIPASPVERALLSDRVKLFQGRSPLSVSPTMPVREVLRLLVDNKVGCVMVMDKGQLMGIFTERDALLKLSENPADWADKPISNYMTANVQSLPPTAKIAFAVHRMDQGGYRHVPVVNDKGEPVGVFSVRDILRYLTKTMAVGK